MLLVIDVGNTNIVYGFYEGENLLNTFRMKTDIHMTADEYEIFFENSLKLKKENGKIKGVSLASVVPKVIEPIKEAILKYFNIEPVIVDSSLELGIDIKYENPKELGADRLANCVAAYTKYKSSLIIIDFGTATTFCAVSSKGEFLGGAICPGINVSLEGLSRKTSKLPGVSIEKPNKAIGSNTVSNILSGVYFGHIGKVKYLISLIKKEMGVEETFVIATGGLSSIIAKDINEINEVSESLTLEGLKIIYEKVKGRC